MRPEASEQRVALPLPGKQASAIRGPEQTELVNPEDDNNDEISMDGAPGSAGGNAGFG